MGGLWRASGWEADRRTWGKGEADGRTGDGRTNGRHGEWRRTGGRADGRMRADGARTGRSGGRADGRTDGRTEAGMPGGRADGGGQWADGRTGQRTGGRRISEGKTPDLMRHLTWPWEIQLGRPRVTVKLSHLPPLSR